MSGRVSTRESQYHKGLFRQTVQALACAASSLLAVLVLIATFAMKVEAHWWQDNLIPIRWLAVAVFPVNGVLMYRLKLRVKAFDAAFPEFSSSDGGHRPMVGATRQERRATERANKKAAKRKAS